MTINQCERRINKLLLTARMNQQYHQILASRWGQIDRGVRIAVGAVAVVSLVLAAVGNGNVYGGSLAIAILGLAIAFTLNVVPFGERETFYSALFQRWSDLREDIESVQIGVTRLDAAETMIPDQMVEAIRHLTSKKNRINAAEPSPYRKLLDKCEGDQYEAMFGQGIRTPQDVDEAKSRHNRDEQANAGAIRPEAGEQEI